MSFYKKEISEVFKDVGSSKDGLSKKQVLTRLKKFGPNLLNVHEKPFWVKVLEPFANVMIGVLFAAGILSLWHQEFIDATIVFAIIFVSAGIDWVQQYSTEKILRSLKKRENENVEVFRESKVESVPAENIVPGDVIILHEGQKIPADSRLTESDNLHVDESMLTGESLSVKKTVEALKGDKEVYAQSNMLFSGSFVVAGAGVAIVVATGNATEFGKIAKLAGDSANSVSPLQQKIDKLVKYVIYAVFVLAILAFGLELARGVDAVEALKFVLAFAVSAVPESLPIAIMVIITLAMRRMAQKKALVRNMRAIENIGLITTIASDKTGTLTRNELRVQETWSPGFNDASMALQISFSLNFAKGKAGDPLDVALAAFSREKHVVAHDGTHEKLMQNLPFDYSFAMSGNVWNFAKTTEIYLKGAPEKILDLCKLSASEIKTAEEKLEEFAGNGFRVIAFAKISTEKSDKKTYKFREITKSKQADFLGFVAVADELRPRVSAAINSAKSAGISVRMITGDHAETAFHIAEKINIAENRKQIYDSRKLMKLNGTELSEVIEGTTVFARVVPEAKYAILTELNKTNITAMTGDGVNDVPALTQANVGVAMGAGAAMAKDAADIVLLDNNFRTIVSAVKEGRIVFANIQRMLVYLLASNAGEVLVTLGALIFGLPLPLVAVQILWINLATDTFMVIPLGLEPGAADVMKKAPNRPDAPVLNAFMISRMIMIAVVMAVADLGVYALFLGWHGEAEARSAAFLVLIVLQWAVAFSIRGEVSFFKLFKVKNKVFFGALIAAFILQVAMILSPFREILHLSTIHADSWVACALAVVLMISSLETHKFIGRKINKAQKTE